MTKLSLITSVLIFFLFQQVSCTYLYPQGNPHQNLINDVASWMADNAVDSETILLPGITISRIGTFPAVSVPDKTNISDTMGIIVFEKPDYVLATRDILWHGVMRHPWFKAHYLPLHTFIQEYDTYTPAQIFKYYPSPFDVGNIVNLTERLVGEGPFIKSYRINTNRIFADRTVFLSLNWTLPTYELVDKINLTFELASLNNQTTYVIHKGSFNPVYETYNDFTDINTYHTFLTPENLKVGSYELRLYLTHDNGAPFYVKASTEQHQKYFSLANLEHPPLVSHSNIVPTHPIDALFSEEGISIFKLTGYDLSTPTIIESGIRVGLVWQVESAPVGDYTVFIHIRDSLNNVMEQVDRKPLNWAYPTIQWEPGQHIYDEYALDFREDTHPGHYQLYIGLYDAQSSQRVKVVDTAGNRYPENEIKLSDIEIR